MTSIVPPANGGVPGYPKKKAQQTRKKQEESSQTRILLIVMKDLRGKPMVNDVWGMMSQFGKVEKVSIFNKEANDQVLVQFEKHECAATAMAHMNGKEVEIEAEFGGTISCKLAIVPSTNNTLRFKREDNRSKDFAHMNNSISSALCSHPPAQNTVFPPYLHQYDFIWGTCLHGRDGWLKPPQEPQYKGCLPHSDGGMPMGEVGNCKHISGLPYEDSDSTEPITAQMLWRVIGQYGSVVATKLLAKHSGCALAQFESNEDAEHAEQCLHKVELFGKRIFVLPSPKKNALHWHGTQTELDSRMCSRSTLPSPPPTPVHLQSPPTRVVKAWSDVPIDTATMLYLRSQLPESQRMVNIMICPRTRTAKLIFSSTEHAFLCIAKFNGMDTESTGRVWMRFERERDDEEKTPPNPVVPAPVNLFQPASQPATLAPNYMFSSMFQVFPQLAHQQLQLQQPSLLPTREPRTVAFEPDSPVSTKTTSEPVIKQENSTCPNCVDPKSPFCPKTGKPHEGAIEDIGDFLDRLDLSGHGYEKRLREEGYERATDLCGSFQDLARIGIKPGHISRMRNHLLESSPSNQRQAVVESSEVLSTSWTNRVRTDPMDHKSPMGQLRNDTCPS